MTISLIICFLSSLFPCFASWTKFRKEYKEANLFLFISAVFYAMLLLYGVVGRITGSISNTASIQQMYAIINDASYDFKQLNPILTVTTIGISVLNIVLGYIFMKTRSPISWGLLFVIIIIGLFSCIGTIVNGVNPLANFFIICCGIMAYFAFVLDLTYKEFCVLGNIYIQATICLLSAIAPLMLSIRKGIKGHLSMIMISFVAINAIAHIIYNYLQALLDAYGICF